MKRRIEQPNSNREAREYNYFLLKLMAIERRKKEEKEKKENKFELG